MYYWTIKVIGKTALQIIVVANSRMWKWSRRCSNSLYLQHPLFTKKIYSSFYGGCAFLFKLEEPEITSDESKLSSMLSLPRLVSKNVLIWDLGLIWSPGNKLLKHWSKYDEYFYISLCFFLFCITVHAPSLFGPLGFFFEICLPKAPLPSAALSLGNTCTVD